MPAKELHENQYRTNIELYKHLESLECKPNDWLVTIYFYTALHIVESILADHSKDSGNHQLRNKSVRTMACFTKVKTKYSALYIESRTARYDCQEITDQKVAKAKQNLEFIIQELL